MLGGCAIAGRDDETHEPIGVDAGDDAVVDTAHFDQAEAASHAYHRPDAPVVMPLELEDAPTSLPPAAALSPPREPKEKRSKQTQTRKRAAGAEPADEDGVVVYSYQLGSEPAKTKSEKSTEKKKAEKPVRDPVAESFLHTQGGSGSYQTRSTTRY